jgi:hypothetical protein
MRFKIVYDAFAASITRLGSVHVVAVAAAVVAWGIGISAACACSVCQCGDPLAPVGTGKLDAGQAQLGLQYEMLTARARSDDDPRFTESLTQMMLRPVLVFSPWSTLTAVVQIPIVYKDWSAATEGFSAAHFKPTGLGDIDLGARFFLFDRKNLDNFSRQRLAISAGSSLPTGENNAQESGVRIEDHAQLGIGALAPYAGVLYAYSQDPWNFFGSLSGKLPLTNAYGYRYGSALLWSMNVEYRLLDGLSFGLGMDGRYARRDIRDGELQPNTGGLVLAAMPVLKVGFSEELWLNFKAQLPILTHLFGEQSVGPTLTASVQYTFH